MFVSARLIPQTPHWRLTFLVLCAMGLLPLGVARAQEPDYEAVGERLIEAEAKIRMEAIKRRTASRPF